MISGGGSNSTSEHKSAGFVVLQCLKDQHLLKVINQWIDLVKTYCLNLGTNCLFQIKLMGVTVSKKQRSRVTKEDKSVLALKQQRDKLMQSRDRISDGIEKDEHDAQVYDQEGQSSRAKTKLRSKEVKEKTFQRIDDNLGKVEQQIHNLWLQKVIDSVLSLIEPFLGQQEGKEEVEIQEERKS